MNDTAENPAKHARWPWALALVIAVGASLAVLARVLLDAERVSRFLLAQAHQATGLEFELSKPAGVDLVPRLAVELDGLVVRAPGAREPLLTAESVDVALPWGTLFGKGITIAGLSVAAPVFDRSAFAAWRADVAEAETGPPGPVEIPRIEAPVRVTGGRIVGAMGWRIEALDLRLSPLREGEPVILQASGQYLDEGIEQPFAARIRTTAREDGDWLRAQPLEIDLGDGSQGPPLVAARGSLALRFPAQLQLELDGSLRRWPRGWPQPLAASVDGGAGATDEDAGAQWQLSYDGAPDFSGAIEASASRSGAELGLAADVAALLDWASGDHRTPLPPARAQFSAPRIEAGTVELSGVRLQLEPQPETGTDDGGAAGADGGDGGR